MSLSPRTAHAMQHMAYFQDYEFDNVRFYLNSRPHESPNGDSCTMTYMSIQIARINNIRCSAHITLFKQYGAAPKEPTPRQRRAQTDELVALFRRCRIKRKDLGDEQQNNPWQFLNVENGPEAEKTV